MAAKKHTKSETKLTETTGADTAHERENARPEADDLKDPKEVWKDAETTPARDKRIGRSGGGERVADAGDVGGGQASPYGTPAQADAVARQTDRKKEPHRPEKPKR